MFEFLRKIGPEQLGKISYFEVDARDVDRDAIPEPPDFCFIDGEHTDKAVLSDFEFCLSVCAPNAAICFHDCAVVFRPLKAILTSLEERGIDFTARKLAGETFGIFLRNCPCPEDPFIRDHSSDGIRWLRTRTIRELIPHWLRVQVRTAYKRLGIRRGHKINA
jgi:hypothetical protein